MDKAKVQFGIFPRLLLVFFAALLVFIVLMRLLFSAVFFKLTYEDDLKSKSSEAASRVERSFSDPAFVDAFISKDLSICAKPLLFLKDYAAIDYEEIWIVAGDTVMISYNSIKDELEFDEIPTRYHPMVQQVFSGKTIGYSPYADIWNRGMFGVACPVFGKDGQPVAAVIMQISNEHLNSATHGADTALFFSSLFAIIASLILLIWLAGRFTIPLKNMKAVATQWETENYAPRTQVVRGDEIGQLAKSMDELADRLLAQQKARSQAEQERARFFADVSHELKTPVTVLRAQLEMLRDHIVTDPKERMQTLTDSLNETTHLQRIIEDLLTLSKLQTPEFQIESRPVCLCDVMMDLKRSQEALAHERGVTLNFEVFLTDKRQCTVWGDYTRIRQMLGILIDNAERYAGTDGSVSVGLSYEDGAVITVSDNGPGMSKEALDHIFERYYTHYRSTGGSGLGLPICRQIALRHNASITMESELGMGSKATIRFPSPAEWDESQI